jgi:hypothetical protein
MRRENVELQNKLEEVLTEHQDLKRERATLARSVVAGAHTNGRSASLGYKVGLRPLDNESRLTIPSRS